MTIEFVTTTPHPGHHRSACHSAEHVHAGMVFSSTVDRGATS